MSPHTPVGSLKVRDVGSSPVTPSRNQPEALLGLTVERVNVDVDNVTAPYRHPELSALHLAIRDTSRGNRP